jgi:hypothetical protein
VTFLTSKFTAAGPINLPTLLRYTPSGPQVIFLTKKGLRVYNILSSIYNPLLCRLFAFTTAAEG